MTSIVPSLIAAGLIGTLSIIPALWPHDGQRLGIWVPPWSSSAAVVSRIAQTDARFVAISDRVVILDGGPGLLSKLREAGIFHAMAASAIVCGTSVRMAPPRSTTSIDA